MCLKECPGDHSVPEGRMSVLKNDKQMSIELQCCVSSLIIILSCFLLKMSNSPAVLAESPLRKPFTCLCHWMDCQFSCFILVQPHITPWEPFLINQYVWLNTSVKQNLCGKMIIWIHSWSAVPVKEDSILFPYVHKNLFWASWIQSTPALHFEDPI
jgi:hypothetical protein